MPLIAIHAIKGGFSPVQKSMMEKATDAMVAIEGEGLRGLVWVKVSKVQGSPWAIGAKVLRASEAKAVAVYRAPPTLLIGNTDLT
jgi:4-oxalocrotonate tautomerase